MMKPDPGCGAGGCRTGASSPKRIPVVRGGSGVSRTFRQSFDFLAGGTAVSLAGFADQAGTFERCARQIHRPDFHVHSVDCSRMREHEFGMSEAGAQGRRDGAFLRPAFSELDQAFRGRALESDLAQLGLQGIEGKLLGCPRRLAHVAHVLHVQIDQVSEQAGIPGRGLTRHLSQIDPALDGDGPFTGIFVAQEGLAGIGCLRFTWTRQGPNFSWVIVANSCALCVYREGVVGRNRAKSTAHGLFIFFDFY